MTSAASPSSKLQGAMQEHAYAGEPRTTSRSRRAERAGRGGNAENTPSCFEIRFIGYCRDAVFSPKRKYTKCPPRKRYIYSCID